MDKNEFKIYLEKNGFKCSFENGVPFVHSTEKCVVKRIKALKNEAGYTSSYGIRFDGAEDIELEETDDEDTSAADANTSLETLDAPAQEEAAEVKEADKKATSESDDVLPISNEPSAETDNNSIASVGFDMFNIFNEDF